MNAAPSEVNGDHGSPEARRDRAPRGDRGHPLPDAPRPRCCHEGADHQAVAALRSTLATIDNAEAVDADAFDAEPALYGGEGHPAVAGGVVGVGATEVDRRVLTPEEMAAIVRDDVEAREIAAEVLERVGRPDQAERLRAQAKLLTTYLDPPGSLPEAPHGR
jgi:hypothetical protein